MGFVNPPLTGGPNFAGWLAYFRMILKRSVLQEHESVKKLDRDEYITVVFPIYGTEPHIGPCL